MNLQRIAFTIFMVPLMACTPKDSSIPGSVKVSPVKSDTSDRLDGTEAEVERPFKELKGFAKVFLVPAETKTISIALDKRDLSFWDVNTNDWLAEPGKFNVMLGTSLADIRLESPFEYKDQ